MKDYFAEIRIGLDRLVLEANLTVPPSAKGLVVFAHGSGSSRFSPRNRFVAEELSAGGFATLLADLLTRSEGERDERTRSLRFDIELLAERLAGITDWAESDPRTRGMAVGYFGASTGAAAALLAAVARTDAVSAIVSRGGRPDLAGDALTQVEAPTLLIVGGEDHGVIELNEKALDVLRCEKQLRIISGATHLFEEEGALEEVAETACDWFAGHLARSRPLATGSENMLR